MYMFKLNDVESMISVLMAALSSPLLPSEDAVRLGVLLGDREGDIHSLENVLDSSDQALNIMREEAPDSPETEAISLGKLSGIDDKTPAKRRNARGRGREIARSAVQLQAGSYRDMARECTAAVKAEALVDRLNAVEIEQGPSKHTIPSHLCFADRTGWRRLATEFRYVRFDSALLVF